MPANKIAEVVIRKTGENGGWGEGQVLTGNITEYNEARIIYLHEDEPTGDGPRRRPTRQWRLSPFTFKSLELSGNPDSLGGQDLTMEIYESYTNGDFQKISVDFTYEEGAGDAWTPGSPAHGRTITLALKKIVKGGAQGEAEGVEGAIAYTDMALPVHGGSSGAEVWADGDNNVLITRNRADGATNRQFNYHVLRNSKVIA